ncbi:ATP-grasp domain-containing protein [Asticcacaulis sp. 201]|uniref:ATP-grasp domain-containing protein n=1 Tax=Asticcacaulis sp. 201 TaxID=3028787 RepID=UPI002915D7BB|nr:ATP-grasp domain-containing protein [Asticcacaulis sp. 201]MDV6330628.1 ATP-grasp domain-containing protein [Asticcacaulis sp. 201]
MSRLLLTGIRAPVAVDLARVLRRQGHTVFGADVLRSAAFGDSAHYRSPVYDPSGFRSDALSLVDRLAPDLIIPLCEDIFYWAQLDVPLFAPDCQTLMRLHSKFAFSRLAADLGLKVPHTERTRDWARDCVFKPEFSRFGTRVLIRPEAGPASDDPQNPWVRQAFVAGEDVCFYAIARQGTLRAFSAYRSAWRTRGGASYHFDPVHEPRLVEIAERLVRALNLTGQLACDLRQDADGEMWLVECNPRATSGLHLLTHDPAGLTAAFIGRMDDGPPVMTGPEPACIGLAMSVLGWPTALAHGRLAQWATDSRRARDVLAGVTWAAAGDSVRHRIGATCAGQSLTAYLTADIECNRWLA